MNPVIKKILTWVVFPVVILLLVYLTVASIMKPVNFNKQKAFRETIAVQRLQDIRTLQVAYKGFYGKYADHIDSLKDYYNNGDMIIVMQVGSLDDSAAVAHTEAVKKKAPRNKKLSSADLYQMYMAGDKNLVFSVETKIPVRDTLLRRDGFSIDDTFVIPFSGGEPVEMEAVIKPVSGVQVPLFEARMPYKQLLKGLDNQLRINLDAECRDRNRYEGLQVGSVSAPNNNAGNWE